MTGLPYSRSVTGHPEVPSFGPTLARKQPLYANSQPSDGPGVTWFQGRPFCASCDTPLNQGSTASPQHDIEARPLRVPLCPLGCSEKGGAA